MADTKNLPYPFQFDPSQWSNPYSSYKGAPFPATSYSGTPTDAHGNPIGSYQAALAAQQVAAAAQAPAASPQGTTLNSTPNAGAFAGLHYMSPSGIQTYPGQVGSYVQTSPGGQLPSGENYGSATPTNIPAQYQFIPAQQQQAAPQAPAAPAGPDMNAAYLAALQNPGHVTTPGATVPQSPTPSGQSGVLQQFLANWNQKGQPTQGAGNYNNAGFYNALQGNV
jgi:hypothetical protein